MRHSATLLCVTVFVAAAATAASPALRDGEMLLVWNRPAGELPKALRRDVLERCGRAPLSRLAFGWPRAARHLEGHGWAIEAQCAFFAIWRAAAQEHTDRPIADEDVFPGGRRASPLPGTEVVTVVWPPDMHVPASLRAVTGDLCAAEGSDEPPLMGTHRCLAHYLWLHLLGEEPGGRAC